MQRNRVIVGTGVDQGSNDTLSRTNSIFLELNEAMNVDSLATRVCKNKRRSDPIGAIPTVPRTLNPHNSSRVSSPSILPMSSSIAIDENTPPVVSQGLHIVPVTEEAPVGVSGIIRECHDQVDSTLREQCWVLEDFKNKTNENVESNVLVGKTMSFILGDYIGGCGSLPSRFSMSHLSPSVIARSFDLANYVGGSDSSPASLSVTIVSFALANCVGSCSSSPTSLSVAAESFTLTNYVGGYTLCLRALV
ncbi:hypothetical protein GOBAR_DD32430 [Gossypium barbadense]|nr:hypothetical protein GOBAR_DD32430 [Gossypium barbadense]